MSGEETTNRISVSRDALRADLAEMELRLRVYFDDQLRHKADATVVAAHALLLDAFGRGEFTDAQKHSIESIAERVLDERTGQSWTTRGRWLQVAAVLLTILSIALAAYFGSRAAQPDSAPTPPEAIS